ncbi:IclR family transcriptional regulator [Limobrevibacterium gyesilva]|uniref:IclR family transcriptional regulator n=1 Tax=Limobrevibacterium gyesilva TaxID=2991712 RepID=A0AA41YR72_9PROT|nr:IclR family transcriptional regulator [Limobrevibacterium gyesilva]MCW3477236.1 IclR family transcriptional regulator [Limobrevibacterium gyesilva]
MSVLSSAADVLKCFSADRRELSVTVVAAMLSLPKSNVSRLLRAMCDAGFLEAVGATRRYRPGVLLAEVGEQYRRASSLLTRADAVVTRVSAECGHTGYVSVRHGRDIMALTDHTGTNMLRVASNIGHRLDAAASATGRSLLARLPDDAVRALYAGPFTPPSATSPQTLDELLGRLALVRRDGYAESNDESNRGVGALAVAVGDPGTGEEVSLCISYPAATITDDERRTIIDALRSGARRIATLVGDPIFHPLSVD